MVAINFNATGVKPNTALEAIPSGQYPVMITASSEKPTKDGQGRYIELEMTVQGGEFGGRKLFDRLNIVNNNQTAVDIAYSTLSAICHVVNRLQIQETTQLHGIPFIAVAIKKERNDQPGSFSNEIKGYKDIQGNDPGFAGNTQGGNGPGSNGNQPSWANNGNGGNGGNGQGQVQQNQQQTQQQPWGNNNGNGQPQNNMNGGAGQVIDHQPLNNGNQQQQQQQQTQQNNGGNADTPPWARGGN